MELYRRLCGEMIFILKSMTCEWNGEIASRAASSIVEKVTKGGGSRPVSRVLSRTAIHLGAWLPIRSSNLPEGSASHAIAPYAVLLRMGFTLPFVLPRTRCALTAPFHPCQPWTGFGGIFSVALSVASRRPVVNRHPALWSPDFPLLMLLLTLRSGCLADFPLLG